MATPPYRRDKGTFHIPLIQPVNQPAIYVDGASQLGFLSSSLLLFISLQQFSRCFRAIYFYFSLGHFEENRRQGKARQGKARRRRRKKKRICSPHERCTHYHHLPKAYGEKYNTLHWNDRTLFFNRDAFLISTLWMCYVRVFTDEEKRRTVCLTDWLTDWIS